MAGRWYRAVVEVVYIGGTLPGDSREALTSAISAGLRQAQDVSFTVRPDPHNTLTVAATLPATNPLEPITALSEAVDRALVQTGLFEEFDVSGKVLRVGPVRIVVRDR